MSNENWTKKDAKVYKGRESGNMEEEVKEMNVKDSRGRE